MSDAESDLQFEIARRAVDRGWVTREQVEAALARRDAEGGRLEEHLELSSDQVRALSSPLPPEVVEAKKDPSRRLGRFWLVSHIRTGGMGSVHRAWDDLGRWVAVKILKAAGDETARAFFQREARLVASLDHPNIARIYDVGETFIAMQFIDGETLAAARLGFDARIDAIRTAGEALRYAHERGVIHRDLKPSNLMVDRSGHVYVIDFGLAKQTEGESLTRTNMTVGTPSYMAPEQARGRTSVQTDVYGLGATLYELLTGRPPFLGDSSADVLAQVMNSDMVWPRKLNPAIPPDVEAILLRALEKEPERRYPGVAPMLEDLAAYRQGNPLRHARRPTWGYVLAKKIRKQPLLWGAVTAGILAAAFGVFSLVQRNAELEGRLRAERQAEATREIDAAGKQFQAGNLPLCLEHARRAQELRPDLPGGWYWEARCRIREYAAYRKLPIPWVSDGMVEFLPPSVEPPEARDLRERATRLVERMQGKEGWEEAGVRGMVHVLQGRYIDGERDLAASLADPRAQWDGEARQYLALSRYYQRKFEAAAETPGILATDLMVRALQGAALEDELRGRSARAIERYEIAEALAKLRSPALRSAILISRGELALRMGRSDEAGRHFERARECAAGDGYQEAEAALASAGYFERRGRRDEAVKLVREAVARYGDDLPSKVRRALARSRLSDLTGGEGKKAAIADLEALGVPDPHLRLVRLRMLPFESAEVSIRLLDDLVREHPDYLPAWLRRSQDLIALAQYQWEALRQDPEATLRRAIADCDHVVSLRADFADAYYCRATIRAHWGDYLEIHGRDPNEQYAKCFEDVEAALRANPEHFESLTKRAEKRLSLRQWKEALEDLDRAIRLNPEWLNCYQWRARVRYHLACETGSLEEIEKGLADCRELDARSVAGAPRFEERACLLFERGRRTKSRADLEACVDELTSTLPRERTPGMFSTTFARLFALRGRALCLLGRHEEARLDFESARDFRHPDGESLLRECRSH